MKDGSRQFNNQIKIKIFNSLSQHWSFRVINNLLLWVKRICVKRIFHESDSCYRSRGDSGSTDDRSVRWSLENLGDWWDTNHYPLRVTNFNEFKRIRRQLLTFSMDKDGNMVARTDSLNSRDDRIAILSSRNARIPHIGTAAAQFQPYLYYYSR